MYKYKLRIFAFIITAGFFTSCACGISKNSTKNKKEMNIYPIVKTDEEWKQQLSPLQYVILRKKATERPYTGEYDKTFDEGTYVCAACGNSLFKSKDKFNSGCGWPAFSLPFEKGSVREKPDNSHGMVRTEILCSQCGGHLGHVFTDGPKDAGGLRYCINSGALKFVPQNTDK